MTPITANDSSHQMASQVPAYRMGGMLIMMGIGHFAVPAPFDSIVPAELPGAARTYTYASGVAEVAIGLSLLAPRTRRIGALAAIALFVAVFPANVNTVRIAWDRGWLVRLGTIARLPFQIPMITNALKIHRNAS
jgi:uncharacterized membrane protein